jgi:hypothetical protein
MGETGLMIWKWLKAGEMLWVSWRERAGRRGLQSEMEAEGRA